MIIKAKRLYPDAILPSRTHPTDAGLDLHSALPVILLPGTRAEVSTGVAVELPGGHYGQVVGRSGLARKGVGILGGAIDSGYRGEIVVFLSYCGLEPLMIEAGDRVAQLVVLALPMLSLVEVDELSTSDRGTSGFGSSGS